MVTQYEHDDKEERIGKDREPPPKGMVKAWQSHPGAGTAPDILYFLIAINFLNLI
jgi:hypothetical protein